MRGREVRECRGGRKGVIGLRAGMDMRIRIMTMVGYTQTCKQQGDWISKDAEWTDEGRRRTCIPVLTCLFTDLILVLLIVCF